VKKKVLVLQTCSGWRGCVKWYQSEKISLFSVAEKKGEFTMLPQRRDRHSPKPEGERESSRERGRPGQNLEVERQLQELRSMIVDMGVKQRCKVDAGYTSEFEDEGDAGQGVGEIPVEDTANEHLVKSIARMSS
jgi:hypothetical protein